MNFDEKVVDRIKRLERKVERLQVKESPIMSNYLLTTGKAADSDKLDGLDSTAFVQASAPSGDQVLTSVAGTPTWAGLNVIEWSPTITPNTGTFTSIRYLDCYYYKLGNLVFVVMSFDGTASTLITSMTVSLPVPAQVTQLSLLFTDANGMINNATDLTLTGNWNGAWQGASGSFFYRAAA